MVTLNPKDYYVDVHTCRDPGNREDRQVTHYIYLLIYTSQDTHSGIGVLDEVNSIGWLLAQTAARHILHLWAKAVDYPNNCVFQEKRIMPDQQTTGLYRSIHAQPAAVRTLLADWDGAAQAAAKLARAKRIFLAGIGTSFHAAHVGEYLLRLAGADAWAVRSFEFVTYPRPLHADDGVIVVSHRGSKLYGDRAVQRAVEAGVLTVGITGKNSKMQGADIRIETVEQDPSSTHSISYTGALTRLAQIATRLAALKGNSEQAERLEQGLAQVPALMEHMLAREGEVQRIAQEAVAQQRRIYFVGAGPNA